MRRGGRAVGRGRRALRRATACRASSACPASPARPARRRSRTSAPTGRTSPRRSRGCASTTARPTRSRRWPPPSAASTTAAASSSTATAGPCSRVAFRLRESELSGPLRYAELRAHARRAGRRRAPLADVRAAVLGLRRGKGMVIDPGDPDSVSAGSFFTNPILTPRGVGGAPRRAAGLPGARRADQDLGGLADRARRLPPRVRGRTRRDLDQAHARAGQPRRGDDGRADGAGARDRRRACEARFGVDAASRAGARRPLVVSYRDLRTRQRVACCPECVRVKNRCASLPASSPPR